MSDSLESLALIFQDINMNSENLSNPDEIFNGPFVVELTNKLISFIDPKHPTSIRLPSFDCLTNLLVASPSELMAKLEPLIRGLLTIVGDLDGRIRQRIYAFLLSVCQMRKDIFVSLSDQIFKVLSKCMHDTDPNAKRACFMIYWEYLTSTDDQESSQIIQLLIPHFEEVVPAFMESTVLTEEDKDNLTTAISAFVEVDSE